jgi:hypothetical protein
VCNNFGIASETDCKPWSPLFSQREASPRIATPYLVFREFVVLTIFGHPLQGSPRFKPTRPAKNESEVGLIEMVTARQAKE